MSNHAIRVEGLGKRYRIGARTARYDTLRDTLADAALAPVRRAAAVLRGHSPEASEEEFWALRDVAFEVARGEALGVIGRNGAGKSTLLKILSRITEPTEGTVRLRGRVGSLLEVGTGFHPELTGRENVYLNGAILGMRRTEIARKFDEIVAFAEIDRFLDTQTKHYSSGMYMRLAFAVAAHLEPEILLVDEVLAVGDAAFQRKCLGKMGSVAREGRTVLFVSHNLVAVTSLCSRAVLLEGGRVVADGPAAEVVERYLHDASTIADRSLAEREDRSGNQALKLTGFELRDGAQQPVPFVVAGKDATLAFRYQARDGVALSDVKIAVGVHGLFDESLFHLSNVISGTDFASLPARGVLCCRVPRLPLQPGRYTFNLFVRVGGEIADWIQNAGAITVEPGDFFQSGRLPPAEQGPLLVEHTWSARED